MNVTIDHTTAAKHLRDSQAEKKRNTQGLAHGREGGRYKRMTACRQDAGATCVRCRLALGGGGGGGGVDGGWDVDGLAVVEVAEAFDGFVDGEFPFVGRRGGDDALEGGGEFAGALPGFFGGAGPGPIDFVLGDVDIVEAGEAEQMVQFAFVGETEDVRRVGRWRGDF